MRSTYWIIGLVIVALMWFGENNIYPFTNPFTVVTTDFNFDGHPVSLTYDSDKNMGLDRSGQLSFSLNGNQERNAVERGGTGYVKMVFEDVSKYDSFSLDMSMSASVSGDERAGASSSALIKAGSYSCNQEADLAHSKNNNIIQITKLKTSIYEVITSCGKQVITHAGSLRPEIRIESLLSNSPYQHGASSSIAVTKINAISTIAGIPTPVPSPVPSPVPPADSGLNILDSLEKLIKAIIAFILIPFIPPF